MDNNIKKAYELAKEKYGKWDIDTDATIEILSGFKISMHCWQGDDIAGFENPDGDLTGGISVTGNYPGKARNGDELRADMDKTFSLIAGNHKVNLHAIYAECDESVSREKLQPKHFAKWVSWAKKQGLGLDYNPTYFSHPFADDGLTLAHPDENIRNFWIEHTIGSRKISEYFGRELNQLSINNIWIPDGFKDTPSNRLAPRERLKDSLDKVFANDTIDKKYSLDTLESKVFGLGSESYVVGSHEFYMNYAAKNNKICLLDTGHYHPTEMVSDKLSAMLLFYDKIALHVSRPVRWDSDHVVTLTDELKELAIEIVRNDAMDRVIVALDFFDATINRIAAWVIGMRNMQKAMLNAMLLPHEHLNMLQDSMDLTARLALQEEFKTYPLGAVWDYFCEVNNVPVGEAWLSDVLDYEKEVLSKR